jgi:hypothetical protein
MIGKAREATILPKETYLEMANTNKKIKILIKAA